jgi:uncharacterized repeat protein (TIGR01451 family)
MNKRNKWLKANTMNKITFIMNILKSIFIATILWLSFAQTASANLVQNPFFAGSAAAATNWTSSATGNGATFNVNTRPVNATITAAGGATEFYSGCQTATCLTFPFVSGTSSGAQQAIPTVIGTTYKLSFWVYSSSASAPGGTIEIAVYWGTTKVPVTAPAGWSLQTTTFTATSASTNLTVLIRDDPNWSAITYMDIEPVVLQLAKTNPASLAVGVSANYTLTATNISSPAVTSGASFTIRDQLPPNIQYNSAAAGAGVTSVSCAASGTVAAGQLVTCTVSVTGGIAPGGTGAITINVTPQAASAGVAGTNRASLEFGPSLTTAPSACTGTDAPQLGCAVAASITPTAGQLTFTKTATLICDTVNGTSSPKNIPGAVVRWTMTVANSGTTSVNLATVTDLISANTTFDANLITGAGGAAGCNSATGTPEAPLPIGKGFKLSIVGGTRPGPYPKFLTTVVDADAASLSGATVTINYAAGLPVETGYTAGQLKPGESVVVYFNVTIN